MRIMQRLRVATALGAAVLLAAACGGGGGSAGGVGEPGEDGITTVQVAFNPASQFAPMFVGMERGIFAEHGLQLEIVPQTDIAAIISGLVLQP